jgi:hypothetical protein
MKWKKTQLGLLTSSFSAIAFLSHRLVLDIIELKTMLASDRYTTLLLAYSPMKKSVEASGFEKLLLAAATREADIY